VTATFGSVLSSLFQHRFINDDPGADGRWEAVVDEDEEL
jgi:hypothetical protein